MDIDFESLKLLPQMFRLIEEVQEKLNTYLPPPTTKKEVARFLEVTPRTINNYMSRGILKKGYHYTLKNGKIPVFVESAIYEFRDKRQRGCI
jgi:predicted DNA-binding protein (UPF0278 family)